MPGLRVLFVCLAAFAPAAAFAETPSEGRLLLDSRTRLESFDQGGLDATAFTTRLRMGWLTPTRMGVTGLIEAEAVAVLGGAYADGVTPDPTHAVIPDPEIMELNRAQLSWAMTTTADLTAGRQRIIFDNARFIGSSGWRQNEQTFDAAKFSLKPIPKATLTYAYAWRVNRSLGRDHPQGVWRGDLHLVNADVLLPSARLTGYGYFLDLDNAKSQSSATVGLRLTGERPVNGVKATWEAEYARQSDWGNAPSDFSLDYVAVSAGLKTQRSSASLVYEWLDGDGRRGFQTPLASLHGFQGWSDVIGATPATGVADAYLRGTTVFDAGKAVKLSGELHDFRTTDGERIGQEADLAVSAPLSKSVSVELGAALFEGSAAAYPDATRSWLTLEYRY